MSKLEYEKAIDEFLEADKQYQVLEEQFMSGDLFSQMLENSSDFSAFLSPEYKENLVSQFRAMVEEFKNLLDTRNTKLQTAKNALRAAVSTSNNQWRGRDGTASTIEYGPFTVSSVTKRWLDGKTLKELATEKGIYRDLLNLKGLDKNGHSYPLVEEVVEVEYDLVSKWLIDHGHQEIVEASYDEKDSTPQVKGPKALAFFGEKKGD